MALIQLVSQFWVTQLDGHTWQMVPWVMAVRVALGVIPWVMAVRVNFRNADLYTFRESVYTSMDLRLRRDRKRSLKFREMLETQGYEQAQDAEERRQREALGQSKRRYTF